MMSLRSITLAAFVFSCALTDAFTVLPSNVAHTSTSLNMFGDALKGAFGNDDSLGKAQDAGLKNVSCRSLRAVHEYNSEEMPLTLTSLLMMRLIFSTFILTGTKSK